MEAGSGVSPAFFRTRCVGPAEQNAATRETRYRALPTARHVRRGEGEPVLESGISKPFSGLACREMEPGRWEH